MARMAAELKSMIIDLVSGVEPTDDIGREHRRNALSWLDGTDDIFRRVKPLTPPGSPCIQISANSSRSAGGRSPNSAMLALTGPNPICCALWTRWTVAGPRRTPGSLDAACLAGASDKGPECGSRGDEPPQ
jgi:hypothetical protein